ncbi:hypothetical protein FHS43_000610 [Streptosporangium becharense]|uniref:Uncharacterized protein n=1 Tax=Streptosporangium becharense TaxID=1816182 RepID=A0A7W9IFB8_9ACTN|nr:hypothetical protein [Streptosporangium becharense]MBB2909364.1 hypothetical protein [Streptosporangium becharense]MBB5819679.1 hypothetical protein [Streptosporangium becharense]
MTAPPTAPFRGCDLIGQSRTRPEASATLFDRCSGTLYRYISRRLGRRSSRTWSVRRS